MCPAGTSVSPANVAEETAQFQRAFEVIDADHDGKISGEDLRSFYASLSISISGEEDDMINGMIAVADANKDGHVQYDEFERVLKGMNKFGMKEREQHYGEAGVMVDVFRVMDQDGDGRLGLDDLRNYLGRVGLQVGDEEIIAMILLGGGDDTEGVSLEGLVNVLAVHDLVS